ncbi:MAG: UDP-N-acetylmuramoyl-tripeptide--D-alanyl-D-alanine ligase [Bacteroidales bacterium]|nr:UDP-N-acetylmuramoyl-tripeptide--D-alanyl-D-alanine ligase [Bacteroidales bacterium]
MEFNREDNKQRIEELYKHFLLNPSITTDSRNIKKGDIFFALNGESFNGNKYAPSALEMGASLCVVDEKEYAINDKYFLVEDVLYTLQLLSNHHRRQFPDLKLLAITGTNGKTTTKELTHAVISQKYNTIATQGNFNNHIGVPLTLLRITPQTEFAIIEMGANHQGEIDFLCKIAEPKYGLITNIGRAHLEGFGGFEGVIKTKTELFRYLDRENHFAIINMDDASLSSYSKEHKNLTYKYSLTNKINSETAKLDFEGHIINSKLIGSYNSHNILAAMTIGKIFEVDLNLSIKAIEDYTPTNHRSQIQKTKDNTLILDCYNANPSSLMVALQDFQALKADNKYAFIGAMKELGEESTKEHKNIVDILRSINLKGVILIGEEFEEFEKDKKDNEIYFKTSSLAKDYLLDNKIKGGTILIKGSHSTKMDVLSDAL